MNKTSNIHTNIIPEKQVYTAALKTGCITEKTINGKKYTVKSVFADGQDIKPALLKLAERKALRKMGLI